MKFTNSITEIADFATFDYQTLYPDNPLFSFFANPYVPFVGVFLYVILSKPTVQIISSLCNITPDSKLLKYGIILHSSILAIYSGWTFVNVSIILFNYYSGINIIYILNNE